MGRPFLTIENRRPQIPNEEPEAILSTARTSRGTRLDVNAALHAIGSTGKGRCWHCDRRLPRPEQAVRAGWDVQRVEGQRVASIILVCPRCQLQRAGMSFPDGSLAARV